MFIHHLLNFATMQWSLKIFSNLILTGSPLLLSYTSSNEKVLPLSSLNLWIKSLIFYSLNKYFSKMDYTTFVAWPISNLVRAKLWRVLMTLKKCFLFWGPFYKIFCCCCYKKIVKNHLKEHFWRLNNWFRVILLKQRNSLLQFS